MRKLTIELGANSYDIQIEDDILFHLSFYIKQIYKNKKIYIITDDVVAQYYLNIVINSLQDSFDVDYVIIPHGEASKSMEVYSDILSKLLEKDIRRNELLLALGGGVVGDITGFVAATLYRGLPYVGIPTTLLSQMDSSIGGKTGIDFYHRKNIIGCFKQPKLVLIDPKTLNTLPREEFNNGMGELIKHAVIGNEALFQKLLMKPSITEDIIYESLKVKKKVVELDEYDLKERMLLNFGHTFGHVIELERSLRHGEAVALGMLMSLRFGIDLGITDASCYEAVFQLLRLYDLPCEEISYSQYLKEIIYDKKNMAGTIQFILIEKIGKPLIYPISEIKVKEFIK